MSTKNILESHAALLAALRSMYSPKERPWLFSDFQSLDKTSFAFRVLGTTHRSFRMPPIQWAAMQSFLTVAHQKPEYDVFKPLFLLGQISAKDESEVLSLAKSLFDSWYSEAQEQLSGADSLNGPETPITRIEPDKWQQLLNSGDRQLPDESSRLTELGSSGPESLALRFASVFDLSATNSLLSVANGITLEDAVRLILGTWSGGRFSPRMPGDWEAAEAWILGPDKKLVTVQDLSSCRAWAVSNASPLHQISDRENIKQLLAWAYRRSSTWRSFRSPDPEIHERVFLAAAQNLESQELFFPWVKAAIIAGRLSPAGDEQSNIIVQEAAKPVDVLLAELDAMVGLQEVKTQIHQIVNLAKVQKDRIAKGLEPEVFDLNMVFLGNPGTGKTTVARLYGQILKAIKVLPSGHLLETSSADLVGRYEGETPFKTRAKIEEATGGILFIDEAYSLSERGGGAIDFGREAINEITAQMEARRGKLAVIVAGYPAKMGKFLASNEGLKSRFRDPVLFPDMSSTDLLGALVEMANKASREFEPAALAAAKKRIEEMPRGDGFGNVREMRKLFSVIKERHAARYVAAAGAVQLNVLSEQDVPSGFMGEPDEERFHQSMGYLDKLVGLGNVKSLITNLANQIRHSNAIRAAGKEVILPNVGHMAFVGSPGTGKTSAAKSIGEVFASLGYLRSGHVIYANRATLIGEYLGQTAPKVRKAVQEALDGVLFIDEAYALAGDTMRDYGPEAIATLLDEMEKYSKRVVVVLAGYAEEMDKFLNANPGFKSRVPHTVVFEDFSEEELISVVKSQTIERHLKITDEAAVLLGKRVYSLRKADGYANARTVRNLLDQAQAKLATRVIEQGELPSGSALITIEIEDVPEALGTTPVAIGFAANP
jgi:SpoVK/Ycf46/Vps4 family AAA+-type ATPase